MSDKTKFRETLLNNPEEIEIIRSIYPPVVDALFRNNESDFKIEFNAFWYVHFWYLVCCFYIFQKCKV